MYVLKPLVCLATIMTILATSAGLGNAHEAGASCPSCEALFGELEASPSGKLVQMLEVQERGEPKSGTGVMFEWATASLIHTCEYLKVHFGQKSCKVFWLGVDPARPKADLFNRTLLFEPALGRDSARCPCNEVERVSVSISKVAKHTLPVDSSCPWAHPRGLSGPNSGCKFSKTRHGTEPPRVRNYRDVWRCMYEAACPIWDNRRQLAVLRDPRAMVVSAFFYRERERSKIGKAPDVDLESYVLKTLPAVCQWVTIRDILFNGLLTDSTILVFYDEMVGNPLAFHRYWLSSVGLHLPSSVVGDMSKRVERGEFPFHTKGIDEHNGGKPASPTRSFRDEVSLSLLQQMDEIVRLWISPALQAKFGVSPL